MRVLLDTNAYTALMRGAPGVADRVRRSERVLLSVVVLGELHYGFQRGSRLRENLAQLEQFLDSPFIEVLPVGRDTAERFGRIAAGLRSRGTPIPTNDIWIAAQAMETGAHLVSFDRHFGSVEGLLWVEPEPV